MGQANSKIKALFELVKKLTLSEEVILKRAIPITDLYEVELEGQVIGPLSKQEIKEKLLSASFENAPIKIKGVIEADWFKLHEHPHFFEATQGPPPSDEDRFLLLIDGKITGHFSRDEIHQKLETKEILYTDLVSSDNGNVWAKFYDLDKFNRKTTDGSLPHIPEGEVFYHSKKSADQAVDNQEDDQKQMMADLAHIGSHKTRSKSKASIPTKEDMPHIEKIDDQEPSSVNNNRSFLFPIVITFLMTISLGLGVFFLLTDQNKKQQIVKSINKKSPKLVTKKRRASSSPIKKARTSKRRGREGRLPARAKNKTSFKDSKSFREAKNKKILSDDPMIKESSRRYDDNDAPVQHDPVRAELTKGTIDPEDHNNNDRYQNENRNNQDREQEQEQDNHREREDDPEQDSYPEQDPYRDSDQEQGAEDSFPDERH